MMISLSTGKILVLASSIAAGQKKVNILLFLLNKMGDLVREATIGCAALVAFIIVVIISVVAGLGVFF